MQQTIRQKLGLPAEQVVTSENANALITQSPYKPSALAMAFSNIFKLLEILKLNLSFGKNEVGCSMEQQMIVRAKKPA